MNRQPRRNPQGPNFYAGQRPPVVKPIDICGRGFYETGRPPSESGGPSFNTPALPTIAWENIARISSQPSWLMFLHAAFDPAWLVPSQYVLLFDLNPGDATQLALMTVGAIARFTLGPPNQPGGTIIYESGAEVVPIADDPEELWSFGLPFNFGIIAAASSTPRVYTPPQLPPPPAAQGVVAITARIQT